MRNTTYLGSNTLSIPEQLISIAILIKAKSWEYPICNLFYTLIKQFYAEEIIMQTMSVDSLVVKEVNMRYLTKYLFKL
jgi:hypothetical protein